MIFQITCNCGCGFSLNKNILKTDTPIKCPSCNAELPNNASNELRACFQNYENAKKSFSNQGMYRLSIHG